VAVAVAAVVAAAAVRGARAPRRTAAADRWPLLRR
jgi:hypothetical protein